MRNISIMQWIVQGNREEAEAQKAYAWVESDLLEGVSLAKECSQLSDTIKKNDDDNKQVSFTECQKQAKNYIISDAYNYMKHMWFAT